MNQNSIQEDSYWFSDGEGEGAVMVAMCLTCSKKQNKGWFWDGKRLGYGDYDLFCHYCGNAINIRKNEDKTDNKNEQ